MSGQRDLRDIGQQRVQDEHQVLLGQGEVVVPGQVRLPHRSKHRVATQARPQLAAARTLHTFLGTERACGAAYSIRRRASWALIRSRSVNSSTVSR